MTINDCRGISVRNNHILAGRIRFSPGAKRDTNLVAVQPEIYSLCGVRVALRTHA